MGSVMEMNCKYSEEEIQAIYHRRNTWVLFLFIPLMIATLLTFRITALQLWQLLLLNIMTMAICLIQGYAWEFFDGMKGVVSNVLFMLTSIVVILAGIDAPERMFLAYGYCCMLIACTTQKPYITTSLLFCFAAMCITASLYIMLFLCFMLLHFSTPAVSYIMQSFNKHLFILELLLIPFIIVGIYTFISVDKIVYLPMISLLISEIIYFIPYFKIKYKRRGVIA